MSEKKISTNSSWYSMTSNRLVATLGPLKGEINCDICIIGAGFTGLSAALELSKKGYSVILLESNTIAASASGKNGGQLIRGYHHSPSALTSKFDRSTAKMMCNLTLEGLALVIERIAKHEIKCDLKFGHVTAALTEDHVSAQQEDVQEWANIGHTDLQLLDRREIRDFVWSKKYIGGIYDPKGAHFHPLNYALGIAQAAQTAGCKIYDETPVISMEHGSSVTIKTAEGTVKAKFVILAGHVDLKGIESLNRKVIAVTAHMIATEPLNEKLAHTLLPKNSAVADANFIVSYFRLSNDNRLLFGGNCNYSSLDYPGQSKILRRKMLEVFPGLSETRIDYCWGGPLDLTLNRMPNFGRLAPNVFYAHGYCGHGIILSNLAGKLIAEAVMGTTERFDIFAKIKHAPLVGGDFLKRPLFVLGMTWYRLRDLLS